ncbi:MAG TPA: carbohydrate ABC transporter permease [Stellaceae bacterium]|nr:carbohydrate ABC transporter permease [Stellaceae bacterium]
MSIVAGAAAALWAVPFAWMAVASLRPGVPADIASLTPAGPFGFGNFAAAWQSGNFPLWYLNTLLLCGGILWVQLVTVSAAGYAFARLDFPGRDALFVLFLVQLLLPPALLIVPNMTTLVALHLYDTLPGVAAPYCASAFGTFLMRQTFRAIPRDYEEAAMLDGAGIAVLIRHVLLPLARPALVAFAIVSVTAHWNEFLWPLMAVSSPSKQVLTVGLASFASGSEAGSAWGIVAAGTFLVAGPLLVLFLVFQRRFVSSFVFSGIK